MTEPEVFILADQTLNKVVQQIRDEQWGMTMPESFQTRQSGPITLREVIAYHAYDDAWIPAMFQGRTIAETGEEAYSGDLLGTEPRTAFAEIVGKACAAAEAVRDLEQPVHFSYGDYSLRDGLWHVISFRGLRAFDIAKVIGVDPTLPQELVQAMWDAFEPQAEEWRAMGVFGPRVEVAPDAPLQDRLLALTGRNPA